MVRRSPRGGQPKVRVSLFVTCLIDQFYPHVGEAVVQVLQRLGVDVGFPPDQTCCGQPAFNGGYRREAAKVARRFLEQFKGAEYVVLPSGSCTSMVKEYYEELFKDDPEALEMAQHVREHTYEFSEFLVNVLGKTDVGASFSGRVAYHDACHLLRGLGISDQPRQLIQSVKGAELVELREAGACCGFGGLFSVKHAPISAAILDKKLQDVEAAEADVLVANDSGCLMQMAGAMSRRGLRTRPMHLAELLAQEEGRVTW
jgi:L-lactate dehydrogenase complex protein LldE